MAFVLPSYSLEVIAALRPVVGRVARHDRSLADQLRRALSSVSLNVAESAYSDPGTQRTRLHTAAGSANEVRAALAVAVAWGYVGPAEVEVALGLLDRILAILWRMLHPRR
jgi:four helix bundle protein